MDLELATLAAALLATAAWLSWRGGRWSRLAALAAGAGLWLPVALWAASRPAPPPPEPEARLPADRTQEPGSPYASSEACRSCHPDEHASWAKSYHRRMTQLASERTILPEWQREVWQQGRRYRLFRDGGRFMVDMPAYGTRGERPEDRVIRPVVMTTGSHHLQLYWVPGATQPTSTSIHDARCAGCHRGEGKARPLAGRGLFQVEIEEALDAAAHQRLVGRALTEPERVAVIAEVLSMQLRDALVQFPLAWLVREQRFVHEDDTFLQPPVAVDLEPYGEGWSDNCDQCHSVAPRVDREGPGPIQSAVAELGIACEACHGPGAAHIERHRDPWARYRAHLSEQPLDDIVLPTRLDAARSAAICGQCHAELVERAGGRLPERFRPGQRLEEHADLVQLHPGPPPRWMHGAITGEPAMFDSTFWPDGTLRMAGRDYNALSESACFRDGELTCTSCHRLHGDDPDDQLAPEARGDAVCAGCHQAIAGELERHTHHPSDSPGSRCYNCHMPRTTPGLLTVMRAHRITSPEATPIDGGGRPNACALCHLDRTPSEIARSLSAWYGQPLPADAAEHDDTAAAVFWVLAGDAAQRAVAAWHMSWPPARAASGEGWQAPLLARLLDDRYAAVRYLAGRSLKQLPGMQDLAYDYVADSASRRASAERALARWRRAAPPIHAERQRRIAYRDGQPDEARVAALEARRDRRPLIINE